MPPVDPLAFALNLLRPLAILTLAAALSAADAPPEPPAFTQLRTYCLEHRGAPRESLAQAAAAGWMPAPRSMAPPPPREFTDGATRWRSTATAIYFLMAGHARRDIGHQIMTFSYCALSQSVGDAAYAKAVEAWIGLPVTQVEPDGGRLFAFIEADGQRRAIDTADDVANLRAFKSGQISIVVMTSDADRVMVAYMTPSLAETTWLAGAGALKGR